MILGEIGLFQYRRFFRVLYEILREFFALIKHHFFGKTDTRIWPIENEDFARMPDSSVGASISLFESHASYNPMF